MNTFKSTFHVALVTACSLLMLAPQSAKPQAIEALATGQAVSTIIGSMEDALQQIIRDLEGAYSRSAFETRSHAIALLQQLQLSSEALVGKTFGELNATQQRFFTDTKLTLDEWHKGNKRALDKLQDVVNDANSVLATLPLSKTWPRVTRYAPTFTVVDPSAKTVAIMVRGSFLGEGDPTLAFGKSICTRDAKTEEALRFTCDRAVLGNPSKLKAVSGKLTVEQRPDGFFETIGSFVGLGKKRTYDIGISVLPSVLGHFDGVAKASVEKEVTETRTESCSRHNGHCEGAYSLNCNITARSGWAIDVNSVSAVATNRSENSRFNGVFDKTTNGFQLRATVRNRGACGPRLPGGARAGVDARGMIALRTTFTERQTQATPTETIIPKGTLQWGQEIAIPLPERVDGVVVNVRRVDGQTQVVTGTATDGWVQAEFRPELRVVVLRARKPEDVL